MKKLTSSLKFLALILCITLISGCSGLNINKSTLTISSAASLSPFLEEIIKAFEKEHDDVDILINYGSSGSLQKQIEQGAPTDLFISAGKKQVDSLEAQHLLVTSSTTSLLTNALVVVEPFVENKIEDENIVSLEDVFSAKQPKYIALGELDTVPAGMYAKEALEHQAMWEVWKEHYVYGKDVREVLSFVEQGNADFGIVYESDAISSKKVRITYRIPSSWHDPILYIGSIVAASEKQDIASQFLTYLQDEKWVALYEQNGFKKVE